MKNTWPEYERSQQKRMKDYENALLEEPPFSDGIESEIMKAHANNTDEAWSDERYQAYKWLTGKILQARHIDRDLKSPVSEKKRKRFATVARDAENISQKNWYALRCN